MKIDLGVEALTPQLTGIGRYTLELMRGLQAHPAIEELRAIHNGIVAPDPEGLLDGVTPEYPRWRKRWHRLAALIRPSLPRLYHGPNFMLPANVESGVITVHDLSVYKFPDMHPPERVAHFERDFRRSLDRAVHVLTDTHEVRRELAEFGAIPESRITAVHLGVNPAYHPGRKNDGSIDYGAYGLQSGSYILLVATFEPRKRIDAALGAFKQLPDAVKKRYPLVLAGATGWRNEALHERMARDEARGYIRFLGFVPERDLPSIYSGARLFLYPSIYEGFGLPPVEAMASGVPVIVSNRSCLPEVTAGAAMLIDPDDEEGFAIAIARGLEDDSWREQAIARGLAVAGGYTWSTCVEKTVDVYRRAG